jgi:ABC-type dipeptide/oligopeptide/nickel transport system permease subunit
MPDLPVAKPELTPSLFEFETEDYTDTERMSRPSLSYWKDAIRRYKTNKIALGALCVLLIVIFMAVFVPVFSSYTYDKVDYGAINQSPSLAHVFGTDELGRDIFVRCWEGARVSLYIAFAAVVINGIIGILYGGIAGFFGGIIDNLLMRFCELIASIPQMLWVILLILIMKPGIMPVIVAISATGWISMARLFRGQVFQIREMEFVMASRTLGATPLWIILKHLLPNAMSPIIVTMTFSIPNAIFAEAFLSYIGLGLPLPLASWGTLASDGANKLLSYPYQLLFPSLLICITMLCFNIMGDALRDSLDPRLRQ